MSVATETKASHTETVGSVDEQFEAVVKSGRLNRIKGGLARAANWLVGELDGSAKYRREARREMKSALKLGDEIAQKGTINGIEVDTIKSHTDGGDVLTVSKKNKYGNVVNLDVLLGDDGNVVGVSVKRIAEVTKAMGAAEPYTEENDAIIMVGGEFATINTVNGKEIYSNTSDYYNDPRGAKSAAESVKSIVGIISR
jgi:hypothetical protein